jgi:hypothetical protein
MENNSSARGSAVVVVAVFNYTTSVNGGHLGTPDWATGIIAFHSRGCVESYVSGMREEGDVYVKVTSANKMNIK